MSLPFHRGQVSSTNMTYRGNTGNKDIKVEEANRSLLEQENDRKWVTIFNSSYYNNYISLDYLQ